MWYFFILLFYFFSHLLASLWTKLYCITPFSPLWASSYKIHSFTILIILTIKITIVLLKFNLHLWFYQLLNIFIPFIPSVFCTIIAINFNFLYIFSPAGPYCLDSSLMRKHGWVRAHTFSYSSSCNGLVNPDLFINVSKGHSCYILMIH